MLRHVYKSLNYQQPQRDKYLWYLKAKQQLRLLFTQKNDNVSRDYF